MTWKKLVVVLTVVMVVVLGVFALKSAGVKTTELLESASIHTAYSVEVALNKPFVIKGMALSGSWEGPGFAEVWLISGNQKFLALNTRKLSAPLELSGFGTRFEAVCFETCSLPLIKPERLIAIVSGPGFLNIDSYHFVVPLNPSGLSSCPNCRLAQQADTPDHSLLLVVLVLAIAVIGAHSCGHFCKNERIKKILLGVFVVAFLTLTGVFGVSIAAPTSAAVLTAKKTASVLAALSVLVLFAMIAYEMIIGRDSEKPEKSPNVWKDLEDAEEKWEKR